MAKWYNDDATDLRSFLYDLIAYDYITEMDGVSKFLDKPQEWDETYEVWVNNHREFTEADEEDSEDESEEEDSE